MDYKYFYSGDFAGVDLTFAFRNSDTASYFGGWLKPSPTPGDRPVIRIPLSDCGEWIRNYGMQDDGNTEFGKSVDRASDAMLHCGKAVIHAAAIKWKGKALLFTADSGTGKSTQVKQWISLFKGEVEIINGDKPILQMEEDHSFTVCPSPWKGKEGWGDDSISASLGGIIFLKQAKENRIERVAPKSMAAPLLTQFFSAFETSDTIHRLCRMEDMLLRNVPVWILENKGDEASACLTHDTLVQEGVW